MRDRAGRSPHVRRFLAWLIRLRGSPRAVAGGAAIGMAIAFTPTPGLQVLLALGLSTLLNANRPAAVVATMLTNPFTSAPVFAATYYVGSFFWPGPAAETVAIALRDATAELEKLDFLALRDQLGVFLALGVDVFVRMWIGGLIVGTAAAAITYPVTRYTVETFRARRSRRREERRDAAH